MGPGDIIDGLGHGSQSKTRGYGLKVYRHRVSEFIPPICVANSVINNHRPHNSLFTSKKIKHDNKSETTNVMYKSAP